MDSGAFVSIIVALIGGISVVLASLNNFRKENQKDHQTVNVQLNKIEQSVKKVGTKLERHITDHDKTMM